jgi:ribulose-phosphate 3-epimerase
MKNNNFDIKIQPSLLACNMGKIQDEINSIDSFVDGIHFDVMDGQFVPNLSFGAPVLEHLSTKTELGFDVHLMCEQPDILLESFANAGAKAICVHMEACPNIHRTLQVIKSFNILAGVVLNPATSYETAYEAIKFADYVLIMSVNPGFGGQKFLPETLEKIEKIRKNFPEKIIQIDGGITEKTAPLAIEAGANWLVAGSAIFKAENREEACKKLRK